MGRANWMKYFIDFAKLASTRSTCLRRQVGAVLVRDNHILATGYNGAPKGIKHCDEVGCVREQHQIPSGQNHELCRGIHAEQNAIIQAAYHGISIKDSTLYCTHSPCSICMKMLINAGIDHVYFIDGYPDDLTKQLAYRSVGLWQYEDGVFKPA